MARRVHLTDRRHCLGPAPDNCPDRACPPHDAHRTCRSSEMELTECPDAKSPQNVTPITVLPVDYVKLFCGWSTPLVAGQENGT